MGHQVEYFIDVPPARARAWLSPLGGRWFTLESPDEMPYGTFGWGDQGLYIALGPTACWVCVTTIKYSWLLDPSPSVEWVTRFEQWLCEALPGVRAVRLDEFLRLAWEREVGRGWEEMPNPVRALWAWLPTQEDQSGYEYFRLLLGIKTEWLTENVVGLAKAIRSDGHSDGVADAVLADALEEAGCEEGALLNYCREAPANSERPGWWIAESILKAGPAMRASPRDMGQPDDHHPDREARQDQREHRGAHG